MIRLDEDLHKHLGISNIDKIDDRYVHRESGVLYDEEKDGIITQDDIELGVYQRVISSIKYGDTDSIFLSFKEFLRYLPQTNMNEIEFILKMSKFRLEPLFSKKLEKYAKKLKGVNFQEFELENINESCLFIAKKFSTRLGRVLI